MPENKLELLGRTASSSPGRRLLPGIRRADLRRRLRRLGNDDRDAQIDALGTAAVAAVDRHDIPALSQRLDRLLSPVEIKIPPGKALASKHLPAIEVDLHILVVEDPPLPVEDRLGILDRHIRSQPDVRRGPRLADWDSGEPLGTENASAGFPVAIAEIQVSPALAGIVRTMAPDRAVIPGAGYEHSPTGQNAVLCHRYLRGELLSESMTAVHDHTHRQRHRVSAQFLAVEAQPAHMPGIRVDLPTNPQHLLAFQISLQPLENGSGHRKLDKLAAHGLIPDRLIGQRPYVRAEIARQVAEALQNVESVKNEGARDYVDRLLKELKRDYREELVQNGALEGSVPAIQGRPLEDGRMDFLYLDQEPQFYVPNNGFGGVRAVSRPLVEKRAGRHYQSGINLAFETSHWMRLGKYFSAQAEPRFQIQGVKGNADAETKVFAQRLNGRFTWNKLDVQIGRDSLNWGPSALGGLVFSNNARPLDYVKLASVMPFRYPFFFKKFGINQWSLVVANLGPEQRFSDPWMVSYKNSNRGSRYLEIGFSQTFILGGDGAPHLSFGDSVAEFFGVGVEDGKRASNRNFDFELIGTIPQARGMNLYAELHFEDFDKNISVLFDEDMSFLGGVYLPRLNDSGTLDLRLEYVRLSPRYARHETFTDGVTENRFLIGDPLGPDAYAISAEVNYDLGEDTLLSGGFRFARRNGDIYSVTRDGDGVTDSAASFDRAEETRFRTTAGVRHRFNDRLTARLGLGVERVQNANFIPGNGRTEWLGEAGLTYYFWPSLEVGRSP